ncbi:MAG: CCA tRNA nucleotidyltransferase [Dehalococcoidales bacterium]|nr:CCA tRNA nucleotidyltransferase [Dehalococcoidales bacterium]
MNKPRTVNLNEEMQEQLPADLLDFIKQAGEAAQKRQQRLYLVGGVVRDLLLERRIVDLDIVVEGDTIKLAREMARRYKAKITVHTRFSTANLLWGKRGVDFTTARAETYEKPGALPTVKPGTITDDLARRDFSVNAMAIELNPPHFGELIDPHGGRRDLKRQAIRVLHDDSFIDDATRIWRAVRYEQRLGFRIIQATVRLLKRDIDYLSTVSGDRIRHELELVLEEEEPENAIKRAGKLGVLNRLHPSLKGDDWLAETFVLARERCIPDEPHPHLYLALLAYRLTATETEQLIKYLRLTKATAQLLRETSAINEKTKELSAPGLAPSSVYNLLHGYGLMALTANSLGSASPTAAEHIDLYLNVLRHINPALSGDDLIKLGVPQGPKIKVVLQTLRAARLDGRIDSKEEEVEMVRGWVKRPPR